jgi:hypothetical protein
VTSGDAHTASAAGEIVRLVDALIRAWDVAPPRERRDGGLAARDIRATAKTLGLTGSHTEDAASVVIEIASLARLVAIDHAAALKSGIAARYAVTSVADDWDSADVTSRWALLATAWARSNSPLYRPAGIALGVLVETGTTSIAWIDSVPAHALANTDRTTALDAARENVAAALTSVMPEEVTEILIQSDLTGIVPGRPSASLERLISRSAVVESRSSATVVRFTASAIERGLSLYDGEVGSVGIDFGASDPGDRETAIPAVGDQSDRPSGTEATAVRDSAAQRLLGDLRAASPYPIPQALEYLVRDANRRRAATAASAAGTGEYRATTGRSPEARRPRLDLGGPLGLGDTATLLYEAIRDKRMVEIEMAGSMGDLVRRVLQPVRLDGGRLRAIDPQRETELTIVVHRIGDVRPVESE